MDNVNIFDCFVKNVEDVGFKKSVSVLYQMLRFNCSTQPLTRQNGQPVYSSMVSLRYHQSNQTDGRWFITI